MIGYFLPAILFAFFCIIYFITYLCKNGFGKNIRDIFATAILLFGISAIIVVVFFPFPIQITEIEFMKTNHIGQHNSFIPFQTICNCVYEAIHYGYWKVLFYQVCGNIIIFIPFGLGLTLNLLDITKKLFRKVFALSLLFSVSIETLQFVFNLLLGYTYRSADIDDIFLNTIGGILGYLLVRVFLENQNK